MQTKKKKKSNKNICQVGKNSNQKNKNRQYIEAYITNKEFVSEAVIPLPLFASQNAEYLIFDQSFMLQCINMSPERTNMKPEQHKYGREATVTAFE